MGLEIRRRARVRAGVFSFAFLFLFPTAVWADPEPGAPPEPQPELAAQGADTADAPTSRLIPSRFCTRGFVYLPRIYYAEERGWGAGGQILYAFSCPADAPGSPSTGSAGGAVGG